MLDLLSGSLVARRLRLVASWLVARSFRGGELVDGETPWWRGDRNSLKGFFPFRQKYEDFMIIY